MNRPGRDSKVRVSPTSGASIMLDSNTEFNSRTAESQGIARTGINTLISLGHSIESQVNGGIQLINRVALEKSGLQLPEIDLVGAPPEAEPGSLDSYCHQMGAAIGMGLTYAPLFKLVRAKCLASSGALGGSRLATKESTLARALTTSAAKTLQNGVVQSGISGAVYDGITRKITPEEALSGSLADFALARINNATVGAATFATLHGAGQFLSSTSFANLIRSGRARSMTVSAFSGLPAGLVNVNVEAAIKHGQAATLDDTGRAMLDFAVVGGMLGALGSRNAEGKGRKAVDAKGKETAAPQSKETAPPQQSKEAVPVESGLEAPPAPSVPIRVSVGSIAPRLRIIETGKEHYFGLVNRKKLAKGEQAFSALGGAVEMTEAGRAKLTESIDARFQEGADARFVIDGSRLEKAFDLFRRRDPSLNEIGMEREIREELGKIELKGQSEPILTPDDLAGIKVRFIDTTPQPQSRGTSAREGELSTRRIFYIHEIEIPENVFKKLGKSPYIRIFSEGEVNAGRTKDGATIADNIFLAPKNPRVLGAAEIAEWIEYSMDSHSRFSTKESNATRKWDGETPYGVHPTWCAMTLLHETRLPAELRKSGAEALALHDVLEDTTRPLPEKTSERVRQLVDGMTFESSRSEMQLIWDRSPEIRLLKLYDKVSNIMDGAWMSQEKRAAYLSYTKRLADDVERNFGALTIVKIARALTNNS